VACRMLSTAKSGSNQRELAGSRGCQGASPGKGPGKGIAVQVWGSVVERRVGGSGAWVHMCVAAGRAQCALHAMGAAGLGKDLERRGEQGTGGPVQGSPQIKGAHEVLGQRVEQWHVGGRS